MASSPPSSRFERLPRKSHAQSPYAPTQLGSASLQLANTHANTSMLQTTSSSVGQRQTQAPRRLPTLVGNASPTSHTEASSSRAAAGSTRTPADLGRPYSYWTHNDDSLLIAAIKKFGNQWAEIKKAVEQAGGQPRPYGSHLSRFQALEAQAARQHHLVSRTTATTSSASDSTAQPPLDTAALLAASAALHARADQPLQAWTRTEIEKLAGFPKSMSKHEVFKSFYTSFPETTRTKVAVVRRWHRLHAAGQSKVPRSRASELAGGGGRRSEQSEAGQEGEDDGMLVHAAERSATSSATLFGAQVVRRELPADASPPAGGPRAAETAQPIGPFDYDHAFALQDSEGETHSAGQREGREEWQAGQEEETAESVEGGRGRGEDERYHGVGGQVEGDEGMAQAAARSNTMASSPRSTTLPSGAASSRALTTQRERRERRSQAPALARSPTHRMLAPEPAGSNTAWSSSSCPSTTNNASQHTNARLTRANGSAHKAIPARSPSRPTETLQQQHASQAPSLDCTVKRNSNGFTIYNPSPNYRFYIPTPVECQVVGPLPPSIMLDDNWTPFEDAAAAPFIFQVDADRAIEAINLPQGTATSICLVRAGVGDGRGEANAGDDGRLVSQTSFVAKDGFSVVFESEVA